MTSLDSIEQQLAAARRDLLELTTSNRLLSTARDQERGSSVEIKAEISTEIYRMLVRENQAMRFEQGDVETEPATDSKRRRTTKAKATAEPVVSAETVDFTKDDVLHTVLAMDELDSRLSKLVTDSAASLQEKGVNVLYLAMGFLRWYEADKPDRPRDAPLVLIPVALQRNKAGVRYSLTYSGEDVAMNLTLQVRLKMDFGIELPDISDTEDFSPEVYFQEVEKAVSSQAAFEVLPNDIVLWFFSFTKLLMYRDLDPECWPTAGPLENKPLIRALLQDGFPPAQPMCADEGLIDDLFDPAQTAHVIDCDSSQSLVIEEACRGRSLVIQGPPGTGKSQTISNLIAAAVSSGKTVLFVAEKMAALEVVKRRLDNIGLGEMCLELHSKMASKATVVKELERVLALGTPQPPSDLNETVKRLKLTRDELNSHVELMHKPLETCGKSPYEILTDLIELRASGTQLPDFQLPQAISWAPDDLQRRTAAVQELSQVINRIGDPATHPWRGVNLDQILPLDLERIVSTAPKLVAALDDLVAAARSLAQRLGDDLPASLNEVERSVRTVRTLLGAPELDAQSASGTMWRDHRQAVQELADAARAIVSAKEKLHGKVADIAWETDVRTVRQTYAANGKSWFRMLNSHYRAARKLLTSLLVVPQPNTFEKRLEILDSLGAHYSAQQDIAKGDAVGQRAFGRFWLGPKSDLVRLSNWEQWDRAAVANGVSPRFRELLSMLEKPDELRQLSQTVEERLRQFLETLGSLGAALKINYEQAFGDFKNLATHAPANSVHKLSEPAANVPAIATPDPTRAAGSTGEATLTEPYGAAALALLNELRARIEAWKNKPEELQHWQTYRRARSIVAEIGSGAVIQRIESQQMAPQQAPDVFRFACAEALLRHALQQHPRLDAFSGEKFGQLIREFSNLDIRRLELARIEVADSHWQSMGRKRAGNLPEAVSILKREMQKKRRHLPLRQLIARAGAAVQAIKPVFMMSPLSVAQFLEAGAIEFDLLLVDEASQVRPVEALGAAARCRQMVVVGDDKQMPPTQFFGVVVGEISADDPTLDMQAGDVESILSLCLARNMPQRMLRWHYRSKHESLIAVSNEQFYDSQLYVIPSPEQSGELGVKFHFIEDGRFHKGKNDIEAKRVAEAIMQHAHSRPKWTLGVGAFSVSQRDAIIDELEKLRKADPSCEVFFDSSAPDPFFVKNLENIQGDERDAIFVSVGYGPGEDGKVSLNFGPVSSSGGERRLNVLMTRAKRVCEIFSSMHAEDIDLRRATGKGPEVFRAYLQFAQLGGKVAGAKGTQTKDRLVEVLSKILQQRGYQVETQVGIAGVFVDLAVKDADQPGRFLLGIDVDGYSYRAGRSARDRDRTRQGVLEGQGWNMYRVWSMEWFRRPTEELNRLVEAIETARRGKYQRSGPLLASTVSEISRKQGGLDPLSASVGELQPIPDRPTRETTSRSSNADIFASVMKLGAKVGAAVLTAEKGKSLDAAIRAITEDEKKKTRSSKKS